MNIQELEWDSRDYWVVSSDFSKDLFKIFKSRKHARQYLTDIKYKILEECENVYYEGIERTASMVQLCFGDKINPKMTGWYFAKMVKVQK